MGVDIYGINPVVTSEKPVEINWDASTDNEKKVYFDALNKWEDEPPGYTHCFSLALAFCTLYIRWGSWETKNKK